MGRGMPRPSSLAMPNAPSMNVPIFVISSVNTDMVVRTPELPRAGQTVMGGDFLVTAGGKGASGALTVRSSR